MTDYLFFLRAKSGETDALHSWLLHEFGPSLAASSDCTGLQIDLAAPPPGGGVLYKDEARHGDELNAAIDLRTRDEAVFSRLASEFLPQLEARSAACFGYLVTISMELDKPDELKGYPTPGYKIMRGFFAFADLPRSAFERSWSAHVRLAKQVHGFSRYVRYFIEKPVTQHAPAIRGATSLYFASDHDVLERYFMIPEGSARIQQDISHFIDGGLARLFAREYVLK